jgi:hypothetical protein
MRCIRSHSSQPEALPRVVRQGLWRKSIRERSSAFKPDQKA